MLSLLNGCSCSKISVHPKGWDKGKISLDQDWYIHYRFYDPSRPRPKQVVIKGMNAFKTLAERRSATVTLLENERDLLMNKGYNPFTGRIQNPTPQEGDISPDTPFIDALWQAYHLVNKATTTKRDIKSMLTGFQKAAAGAGLMAIPISQVTQKYIKRILLLCKDVVPGWSANRFNSYRSYLMMLFNELIEIEATDIDPVSKIKKQKTIKKLRTVLQPDQRRAIDVHLRKKNYPFWRFVQIFFHSGARTTELMGVKKTDVDLSGQRYKVTIQKGKKYIETWKVIKNVAAPFWREILDAAGEKDYLFSKGLVPGGQLISAAQINRRWKRHVKDELKIDVDFYSLKHLNLDETAAALSALDAARMASHTTPVITISHYLVGEKERQEERLKKVDNTF
jgi:site-specific recombinase XerC